MNSKCQICFENNTNNNIPPCKHFACTSCLRDYILHRINNKKLDEMNCFFKDCKQILSKKLILQILNEEEKKKYMNYLTEIEILTSPNLKFCPYPNCLSSIEKSSDGPSICKNGHNVCFNCLSTKYHPNLSCDDSLQRKITKYLYDADFVIQCPKCLLFMEKNGGCNHLTCLYCKHQFCRLCKQPYQSGHFSSEGKCYKNQWTEFRTENEINSMFARDNMSLRQDNVKKLDPEILKKFNKK